MRYGMNKEFLKVTGLYAGGVVVVLYVMWLLLGIALPEAHVNVIQALSTAFGINLPDNYAGAVSGGRTAMVVAIVSILSILLIILNAFFGAIITSYFIRPKVDLITSTFGILSITWRGDAPYVLVRMSNFHSHDLADVNFSAVISIQETRETGSGSEDFMTSIPLSTHTPQRILLMRPNMPWTFAIPADAVISGSLAKDYHFKPGVPIEKSFTPGKTLLHVKRTVEILVQGIDTKSSASFIAHRKIVIDEQTGDDYTLHLTRGAFKSLPLYVHSTEELMQCVE